MTLKIFGAAGCAALMAAAVAAPAAAQSQYRAYPNYDDPNYARSVQDYEAQRDAYANQRDAYENDADAYEAQQDAYAGQRQAYLNALAAYNARYRYRCHWETRGFDDGYGVQYRRVRLCADSRGFFHVSP